MKQKFFSLFMMLFLAGSLCLAPAFSTPSNQDNQNDRRDADMDTMRRGLDKPGSTGVRSNDRKFGDNIGHNYEFPDAHDRRAAALFGEIFTDGNQRIGEEDISKAESKINSLYGEPADEQKYAEENARVAAEKEEKAKQLAKEKQEGIERQRKMAWESCERYEELALRDGEWSSEELEEYDRRYTEYLKTAELTPSEQAELARQQDVRTDVYDEITRTANNLGGTSTEEVQERMDRAKQFDAGTKTWRNVTFTGRMANEVGQDIAQNRERGIKAKNKVLAAQMYIDRTDITDEQRAIARTILDQNQREMGVAADAISKDAALITLGAASDIAMLGIGRVVAHGVDKVGTALRGGETAAGTELGSAGANAGAEAGAAGSQAGKTGAQSGGTAAGEAGSSAGNTTRQLTQAEQQAASQAYNDAKAAEAVAANKSAPIDMQGKVGNTVMLGEEAAEAGATASTAPGALSKNLTQAEIDQLFKPGVNLTRDQIAQKLDLIRSGRAPTRTVDPETYRALDQAMQKNFPEIGLQRLANFFGQGADEAAGAAANSGSGAGNAGAAAGEALPQWLQPNAGFNPGISSGGTVIGEAAGSGANATGQAASSGTQAFNQVLQPGANAAGGTTQAFNQVLQTGETAAAGNAANATQSFKQVLQPPKLGQPTPAQIKAAEDAHATLKQIADEPLN